MSRGEMEIKIDEEGLLYVKRAGKWKGQVCPYHQTIQGCGDWCPLFLEAMVLEDDKNDNCYHNYLDLTCSSSLNANKIIEDKRQ